MTIGHALSPIIRQMLNGATGRSIRFAGYVTASIVLGCAQPMPMSGPYVPLSPWDLFSLNLESTGTASIGEVLVVTGGRFKHLSDGTVFLFSPDEVRLVSACLSRQHPHVKMSAFSGSSGDNVHVDSSTVLQSLEDGRLLMAADAEIRAVPGVGVTVDLSDVLDPSTGARADGVWICVPDSYLASADD